MKNTDYTLYLDMDGVLTDFDQGFADIYYSIGGTMSPKEREAEARKLYGKSGSQFWVNLDWMQGGPELWKAANELFETIGILSSAQAKSKERHEEVLQGKLAWIKTHIPEIPEDHIFIVADKTHKQNFSNKLSILVDDRESTIKEWNKRGGYGILHKASHYRDTIAELEEIAQPLALSEIVKRFRH